MNKDIITEAVKVARKRAKIENGRFHDSGTAPSGMATQGVQVDVAMKAAEYNRSPSISDM